jgi:predicted chitinase
LRRILGRGPDASDPLEPAAPTADGRIDSVFGSIHVYLPAGTPTRSAPPVEHLRANVVATGASTPPGQVAPDTLGQAQWVSITCNKGSATVVSRDRFGQPIGAAPSETDFEYNLYAEANRRHDSLFRAMPGTPAAAGSAPPPPNSSPSGWYELLRFGRKLGPDPLPEAAAHWRRIATPQGLVWADLNAQGTFKFSDADFPHALGWHCFGDDASPTDQRCDSLHLKRLISDRDPANPHRLTTGHLVKRLGREDVRARLRRAICRFPSEWDQKDIEARYGWLRAAEENSTDDDASATRKWQRFVIHARALSFPDLPADFLKAQWRFHPREFIGVMRKCGWLSKEDLVQTLPMHAMRLVKGTYLWEQVPATNANFATNPIARDHRIPMNVALRRWAINTPTRMATFLGNSLQETMWLGRLSELGGPGLWYAPWYGRGFLQLTNPANYVAYWRYRGRQVLESLHTAMVVEYKKIAALAPSQRSNSGLQDSNFSSLNQDILRWRSEVSSDNPAKTEEDFFAPADSAGFYWAKNGMSKEADVTHALERVSISTNTGTKIYYRSSSFWRASATVNLPGAVGRTNYTGINGFDARCVAYGYALAVLTEMKFIDDDGQKSLWFPDTNLPRRAK